MGQFSVSANGFCDPNWKLMTVSIMLMVVSHGFKHPPSLEKSASTLYVPVPSSSKLSLTRLEVPTVLPVELRICQLTFGALPPVKFLTFKVSLLQPL